MGRKFFGACLAAVIGVVLTGFVLHNRRPTQHKYIFINETADHRFD